MTKINPILEEVPVKYDSDCVAIFSGGMDSTVLVYHLLDMGHTPHLISFNYGQRHNKELQYAAKTAGKLDLRHDIVDLTGITHLISNSALTSHHVPDSMDPASSEYFPMVEVPEGHYAEDNMKKTVVPNRNMIMLSIAGGIAVNNNYTFVATGVHAGDHFIYPDCRPEFIYSMNESLVTGNEGFGSIPELPPIEAGRPLYRFLKAPFLNWSKEDIAYEALRLGVPFEDTWSCYKGGEKHCGKCGTCVERLEAIHEAGKHFFGDDRILDSFDMTKYEDNEFWKGAVKNAKG